MKPSSAKAKGRRLQNQVVDVILEAYSELEEGDVRGAIMGESGEDIKMSPKASKIVPLSIECKNQEKINIWKSFDQAKENAPTGKIPTLVYKKNRSDVMVTLKLDDFIKLLKKDS